MEHTLNTSFIGKNRIDYESLSSTNKEAHILLSKNNPIEGTVITARFQTEGRGQIGRYWHSEADKNFLASIILYPSFVKIADQFDLSMITSLAIMDVLKSLKIEGASIKWPNDIYVNDQKLSGILIQNSISSSGIKSTILGIGLNVNQLKWPSSIPNPTSLKTITNENMDIQVVLEKLCMYLEKRYLQLKSGGRAEIKSTYHDLLYRKNERHQFTTENKTFAATILGIDEAGRLKVKLENDSIKSFNFREISFVL